MYMADTAKSAPRTVVPEPEELEFFGTLDHKIRVAILTLLYENVEMSYTELLEMLGIDEGLLNFHLRKMRKIVKTTDARTYMLSDYGKLAYAVLDEIRKKATLRKEPTSSISGPSLMLTADLVTRRTMAFILDALILVVSTGLFLEKNFMRLFTSLPQLGFQSLPIPELTYETIASYSHIFFAAYIIFTILEAYKGQTPGKYVLGIRVVKIRLTGGSGRISLMDSAVRNLGKVFLLPLDLLVGILLYARRGYLRFFDYYTRCTVERAFAA